ncbi:Putative ribosomal N-acetyltransferase YdaF [Vibrio aerogenes CECT 7868]|uniref:Putative ribosomal N-acetyltransferase YdaF n=2 Tax=Vibrio aerogenes TaxID=92172 RepID=A0A1M5ZTZ2_9VIBR|nr:Putative ribosomal N-acetyltransferase YdaF [Vibrio aerogenes CECT 7868]
MSICLINESILLRTAFPSEYEVLYQLMTRDESWTKFNGPYFGYSRPSLSSFKTGTFQRLLQGEDMLLIEVQGQAVGAVSYYWECEVTRWLEAGIVIYDSVYWNQGIGCKALVPWISYLFDTLEIERVGLTTWSGNVRMMACAERLGLKQEARLRKVRFYQGTYYDSVKYGVLREEWVALHPPESYLKVTA